MQQLLNVTKSLSDSHRVNDEKESVMNLIKKAFLVIVALLALAENGSADGKFEGLRIFHGCDLLVLHRHIFITDTAEGMGFEPMIP